MGSFIIKFRGVRGSIPTPGQSTLKYGGNTSCIEVKIKDQSFIFDAGTGIIQLGNELLGRSLQKKEPIQTSIFFSHHHHDHNQGLPFFKPIYFPGSKIHLFGPRMGALSFKDIITKIFQAPFFPVSFHDLGAEKFLYEFTPNDAVLYQNGIALPKLIKRQEMPQKNPEDILVEANRSYSHPQNGVFFYKISYKGKKVVYATDTEGYIGDDQKLISFVHEADMLIHDAQFTYEDYIGKNTMTKQGFGHSTPEFAISIAKKANVKNLFLTHFDPDYDEEKLEKMLEDSRKSFPNTFLAKENDEINLNVE